MKFTLPLSAALLALATSTSAMAANLTIPMSFEYLALDGKEIDTNMFTHKTDLELDNGSHKIAIRYHDMVDDDFSDSQSFVKSSPFIVAINVDGDHEYQLKPIDGEFVKKPKSFAKDPQIVISRKDNGAVDYKVTQTDYEESTFISNLFSGNKGEDIDTLAASATDSNTKTLPVAAVATSATVTATAPAASKPAVKVATPAAGETATHPEQMLQYWWLQADEETRKEFMSWAIKQL
ncbi:DUF2057 domain-containing protein [Shewanella electrodiphila]|uniref:DUF2057 domain-containing protein n=1 Tax=Shewanella electrodiphila TaxID=934143 RepID=A0ABT0KR10_9GAMM|nr:DUF2057 domain-containing protein [Shewanella electrodiphila]MCL1046178.1 DUF2057 domain-containing protein [Shewanella electrodiphila]